MNQPIKTKFGNKTAYLVEITPELLSKNPSALDIIYKDIKYLILFKKLIDK